MIEEKTMPIRNGSAVWEGDLLTGKGQMKFGSGAFEGNYSFSSRFEDGVGTNPEELIAAAHAGCFSMELANRLAQAGFEPKHIETNAKVNIAKVAKGYKIITIDLITQAEVPGIKESKFLELANEAKKNCPVSQLVTGAEVRLQTKLMG
jgi:osmotically inducible protein OsmC